MSWVVLAGKITGFMAIACAIGSLTGIINSNRDVEIDEQQK